MLCKVSTNTRFIVYLNERQEETENYYESQDSTVKLYVAQSIVAKIIGKYGSTKRRFEEEFECKIAVSQSICVNT